jgi:hypothetical protein
MTDWKLAALPLIGVVLGAGLQHFLSRSAKKAEHTAQMQAKAYTDYLRAVAQSSHLGSDADLREAHLNAADAKSRISVYGSGRVVSALANFERTGARINDDPGEEAFLTLVNEMRPDNQNTTREDLKIVLFGPPR